LPGARTSSVVVVVTVLAKPFGPETAIAAAAGATSPDTVKVSRPVAAAYLMVVATPTASPTTVTVCVGGVAA